MFFRPSSRRPLSSTSGTVPAQRYTLTESPSFPMEPPNNPPPTAIHASLARLSRPNPVLAAIVNLNLKATIRRPLLLPLGLFALLMLYLGLVPRHQMPNWLAKINDKVLHAGCFGVLSVLMVLSWELEDLAPEMTDLDTRQFGTLDGFVKTVKRVLRTKVGITGLVMLAMGWGSELVQELLSPVGLTWVLTPMTEYVLMSRFRRFRLEHMTLWTWLPTCLESPWDSRSASWLIEHTLLGLEPLLVITRPFNSLI